VLRSRAGVRPRPSAINRVIESSRAAEADHGSGREGDRKGTGRSVHRMGTCCGRVGPTPQGFRPTMEGIPGDVDRDALRGASREAALQGSAWRKPCPAGRARKNRGRLPKRGQPDCISDSSRCGPERATRGCLSRFGLGRSFCRKRLWWKDAHARCESLREAPDP
jgi:hypothetical protein